MVNWTPARLKEFSPGTKPRSGPACGEAAAAGVPPGTGASFAVAPGSVFNSPLPPSFRTGESPSDGSTVTVPSPATWIFASGMPV
ncbi:hypothetical protein JW777_10840 [bacterium]|nr:hypothetical protein [bacterium]